MESIFAADNIKSDFFPRIKISACLYATVMGICQTYLNGQQISQDYFTPGWAGYDKRIYYRTYDVTSFLKKGDKCPRGQFC